MKKKILLCLITVFSIMLFGCEAKTKEEIGSTFVSYRINPEIGLFVSATNEVLDTVALNSDADILLVDLDLKNKDLDEASEIIINQAIKTGFIDSESMNTEVFVDVETDDEEKKEEILEKVQKTIDEYFVNNGIFGKVSKDTLDKYVLEAQELNLPIGKTKMILLALELNPDLIISDVKDLTINELVKLCHKNFKENNFNYTLNREYKEKILTLKEKYQAMFALEEEIESIKERLSDENIVNLLEEDILALQAELNEKESLYNSLNEAYNKEKDAIKQEIKSKKAEQKKEHKIQKTNKEKENSSKNKNHQEAFNKDKVKVKDCVKEFQDLKTELNNDLNALKVEYNLDELEKELENLKIKLEDSSLTDEEIHLIEEEIVVKTTQLRTLKDEFKEKSDQLLSEFKVKKDLIKGKINSKNTTK